VSCLLLDTVSLLERVARKVPADLRPNTVVIGSIAAAWSFRDVAGSHAVATKDIDLLLRPAVAATPVLAACTRINAANWLLQPCRVCSICVATSEKPTRSPSSESWRHTRRASPLLNEPSTLCWNSWRAYETAR